MTSEEREDHAQEARRAAVAAVIAKAPPLDEATTDRLRYLLDPRTDARDARSAGAA